MTDKDQSWGTAYGSMDTGVASLDALLERPQGIDGHLVYSAPVGLFGVIMGAAGTGKSVLSLQLACRFVQAANGTPRRRHRAIYVSNEPGAVVIARAVGQFGFIAENRITECEMDLLDEEKVLAVVQMPLETMRQRDRMARLVECAAGVARCGRGSELLLCVDNAETIVRAAHEELVRTAGTVGDREFYKRLREECARHRLHSWWSYEEEREAGGGDTSTISVASTSQVYAADIAIRMSAREMGGTDYRERDLEIIKARHQHVRRGRHPISIFDKTSEDGRKQPGIVVWPSIATQLSRIRSEIETASRSPRVRRAAFRLGIEEVDAAVSAELGKERYLTAGTVGVLVSDLDSLSTAIGVYFASQAEHKAERTIYFTTTGDQDLRAKIEKRRASFGASVVPKVDIVPLPPDFVSEAKLLHEIAARIHSRDGRPRRVVFDNLFRLKAHFPLIRDETAFLKALFTIFRAAGVAALVIDVIDAGEGRNPLSESCAAGLAENVFLLRHVEFQSRLSRVFHVLKLENGREPKHFWQLREGDRHGSIVAEDMIEFHKGILSGRPERLEINLSLYAEAEGSPLDLYLRTQGGVMAQTYGQTVKIDVCHPDAYAALQNSLAAGGLHPLGDCHVISIDEIWINQLVQDDMLEPIPRRSLVGQRGSSDGSYKAGQWVTMGYDIALDRHFARLIASEGPESTRVETLVKQYRKEEYLALPDRNNVGVLAYNPNVWCGETGRAQDGSHAARWAPLQAWARDLAARQHGAGGLSAKLDAAARDDLATFPWESAELDLTWDDLVRLQSAYVEGIAPPEADWGKWLTPSIYREWEDWQQGKGTTESDVRRFRERRHALQAAGPTCSVPMPGWAVFTLSMNQRESCVSFLLELVLSLLPDDDSGLIESDGSLRWFVGRAGTIGPESPWFRALLLLIRLLSPWDLLRLAHGWYRSTNDERPSLFSRQWFSNWGAMGLREPGMAVRELPRGAGRSAPAAVSGTWYLGILRGSTARDAGARLVHHLTSESTESYKVNRGIGMPVRRHFYGTADVEPMEVRHFLPYRKQYLALADAQARHMESHVDFTTGSWISPEVRRSLCPFSRALVKHYVHLSPLLMGMMVRAARASLACEYRRWMWQRMSAGEPPVALVAAVADIVREAHKRAQQIVERAEAG